MKVNFAAVMIVLLLASSSAAQTRLKGELRFEDGTYTGEVRNGQPDGNGVYEWNNGDRYSGSWLNGSMNGQGVCFWNDSSLYSGEWRDNKMSGPGTLTTASGLTMQGTFADNRLIDGTRTFTDGKNSIIIQRVIEGVKQNRLTITASDGTRGDLPLNYNSITGARAFIMYSNGDRYEGSLKDGLKNGRGVYTWSDGRHYRGVFKDDLLEGEAVLFYEPGTQGARLEGNFKRGFPHGKLYYYDIDGIRFRTVWRNGRQVKPQSEILLDGPDFTQRNKFMKDIKPLLQAMNDDFSLTGLR